MPIASLARRAIPSSLRKRLRNLLSPRHARTWTLDPARIPWFDRPEALEQLDNYPQTNLRTASPAVSHEYREHVKRLTSQYERQMFLAKKGDVFLWHGMTLHGGSEIENPQLTRKSFVIHYMPRGMNVFGRIVGPFNW